MSLNFLVVKILCQYINDNKYSDTWDTNKHLHTLASNKYNPI